MADPFDSVVLGDLVTTSAILADGWVAVRGEIIAQIGQGAPPPARVAATLLRGQVIWDGADVLAQPGSGRFIRRAN